MARELTNLVSGQREMRGRADLSVVLVRRLGPVFCGDIVGILLWFRLLAARRVTRSRRSDATKIAVDSVRCLVSAVNVLGDR